MTALGKAHRACIPSQVGVATQLASNCDHVVVTANNAPAGIKRTVDLASVMISSRVGDSRGTGEDMGVPTGETLGVETPTRSGPWEPDPSADWLLVGNRGASIMGNAARRKSACEAGRRSPERSQGPESLSEPWILLHGL